VILAKHNMNEPFDMDEIQKGLSTKSDQELIGILESPADWMPSVLELTRSELRRRSISPEQIEDRVALVAKQKLEKPVSRSFFRWRSAAIALWLLGVVYGIVGVGNGWLAVKASRGEIQYVPGGGPGKIQPGSGRPDVKLAHGNFLSAEENAGIALLCIGAWYFMRRRTPPALAGGAMAVVFAFLISLQRWIFWADRRHFDPWEPFLLWPFFFYALVYAYRVGTRKTVE
jgi:hypothetical protein